MLVADVIRGSPKRAEFADLERLGYEVHAPSLESVPLESSGCIESNSVPQNFMSTWMLRMWTSFGNRVLAYVIN